MRKIYAVLLTILLASVSYGGTGSISPPSSEIIGSQSPCTPTQFAKTGATNVWECANDPGAGSGAPTDAQYWTGAADGTLSAEKNLGGLGTGAVINTAGVPSIYAGGTCTNQFIRGLTASIGLTCESVSAAEVVFTPAGTIAATDVQAALEELSSEKAATVSAVMDGDSAGGDLTGTYPNPTIAANSIALGTDTTGDYIAGVTANQGLAKTGTEAGTLGLIPCTDGKILKNSGGTSWACADDGGGSVTNFTDLGDVPTSYTAAASKIASVNATEDALEFTDAEDAPFTPTGTIAATTLGTAIAEVASESIQTSTKNQASGVAGLTSGTKLVFTQIDSYAAHAAVAATGQITVTARVMGIASSGGDVTMTTGNPRVSFTGLADGTVFTLVGTSLTDRLIIPNGQGVRLCNNKGSVTIGLNDESPTFRYNSGASEIKRIDCPRFPDISAFIEADETTPVCIGNAADADYQCFFTEAGVNKHIGYDNGVPSTTTTFDDIAATGDLTVDGAIHGPQAPIPGVCQVIDSVTATDDNRPLDASNRARTITGVWCNYAGSAPTTPATFTLEDGSGNAMTITGTNPTCAAPGTAATVAAVTAGNTLTARELLRFDVTNTPNPATDTYILCVSWDVTD